MSVYSLFINWLCVCVSWCGNEISDRKLCLGFQNNPSFGCQRILYGIYIFIIPFCSKHTHTHIHLLYRSNMNVFTQYTHIWQTASRSDSLELSKHLLWIFSVFGGVRGKMVMVTMENVSFQDTEWFPFRFDAFVICPFPNFCFCSENLMKKNMKWLSTSIVEHICW